MNELIEKFWVENGGKPHMDADLWFYESDWNMLMPVVDLIETLEGCDFQMHTGWSDVKNKSGKTVCLIRIPKRERIIISDRSRIIAVYSAVIEFIKLYNENEKDY